MLCFLLKNLVQHNSQFTPSKCARLWIVETVCRKFEGLTPGGWCGCVLGTVAWLAGVRAHCAAADHWSLAGGGWWRGRAAARRALCLHIQRAAAPRPPPPPTLRTCCRADHGDTTPPATCNRESRVIIVVIVVPILTLFY